MVIGIVLAGVAAVFAVAVVGLVCWLAGSQLLSFLKIAFAAVALCSVVGGAAVLTGNVPDLGSGGTRRLGETRRETPRPSTEKNLTGGELDQLAGLHRGVSQIFVESPGFGLSRTIRFVPLDDVVRKPEPGARQPESEADAARRMLLDGAERDPRGDHTGIKDVFTNWEIERPAAGGGAPERWTPRRIELVGLLKHEEPVVYLTSDKLPGMKNVGDIPTRPLDAFETEALAALRRGENLKVSFTEDQLRMVGPLWAGRKCHGCHGEQKDQLLGAFTYELRRAPKPDRAAEDALP